MINGILSVMDSTVLVSYTLLVTGGITILYVLLLAIEAKKGVRLGKKFRTYLDRKTTALTKGLNKNAALVNTLYERGTDEVEKDLIDPMTKPIIETQQRYIKLKTGEREIKHAEKKDASPHLRKMLHTHKRRMKANRRRSRKQRKKMRKEMQELQEKK